MSENFVDILLYVAYGLLGLGVALIILFLLKSLIGNPRQALRSLIGVAILAALYGIFYSMADSTPLGNVEVSAEVLRFVGALLRMTYVAFGLAIGLMILSELYNLVR